MSRRCDFPPRTCGRDVVTRAKVVLGKREMTADYCAEHSPLVEEAVLKMGLVHTATRVDNKQRAVYRTATGGAFSASEARAWLREMGHDAGSAPGRLSRELIEEYADAH